MIQLVLIERYRSSSFFWPNLIKSKKISELSVEEILNKYQGFEGELVSRFLINENESEFELQAIISKCLKTNSLNNYSMLYLISNSDIISPPIIEQTFQVGFDIGVCEGEKTVYSSIFNEILFGHVDELIACQNFLNENLLFPDKYLAENYVNLHNYLSAQEKSVEDYEEMIIYEVRKQK